MISGEQLNAGITPAVGYKLLLYALPLPHHTFENI
jgi:hypothetical protein